ncbi:MAG TPA: hypothetical protein VHB46_00860 [Burkholderiales bacterium]|nr:hypothetical protein [Burkholderiales bacterium]
MKTTKLILAAGLAIAATGAFAETTVTTYSEQVAQVYGRASSPNVRIVESGQDSAKSDTKVAVTAGKEAIEFGRS